MGELLFAVLLLVIGGFFFLQTLDFKVIALMDPVMGPARFPQIVIVVLMVSVLGLIIKRILRKETSQFVFKELFQGVQLRFGLMILVYIVLLERAGFLLTSSLFLIASTTYLYFVEHKAVPKKITLVRSLLIVGATFCVQMLFTKAMGVMLPIGTWF